MKTTSIYDRGFATKFGIILQPVALITYLLIALTPLPIYLKQTITVLFLLTAFFFVWVSCVVIWRSKHERSSSSK